MSTENIEIDMTIPSASEVEVQEEQVQEEQELLTLEMMVEHLPNLEVSELMELMDKVNAVLKKKWKSQTGTKSKGKSQVEKPKKPASKALRRTQAWIPYVQKHAMDNGWDSFVIRQESKNKETGETEVEEIEKSASVLNEPTDDKPAHTFKDVKSGEIITPTYIFADTGKHLIYKEAMSLSAKWKWREGVKPAQKFKDEDEERSHWSDLFQSFVDQYDDQEQSSSSSSSSSASSSVASTPSSSPKVRRLTAAEKEEEKEEKKRIVEEEKERKRQEKEEEKERKRQEKEEEKQRKDEEKERKRLEKEEEKRQKEEEKEQKRQEKEAKKSPSASSVKKSPIPAAKVSKVVPSTGNKAATATTSTATTKATTSTATSTTTKAATPTTATSKAITPAKSVAPKALTKPKEEAKPKEEVMTWNIPEDDLVHKWTWKGKTYLVNHLKCVWERLPSGDAGNWVGLVILEENRIDTSYEEPTYEEDDE